MMSLSGERIAVNQVSTNGLGLLEAIEAYARAGVRGITPWQDKVDAVGVPRARRAIRDAGLSVAGFCLGGKFTQHGIEGKARAIADARRSIDMARELGAPSIATVAGGLLPGSRDFGEARAFAFDCLAETAAYANAVGLRLALEPLHPMYAPDWSVVTTLAEANDWAEKVGDGVGVAVDTYHVWWDRHLAEEIVRAGRKDNLVSFHVSDWLVPTVDLLFDRGLPGAGVIGIASIRAAMEAAGFSGWVEVELFSHRLWKLPAQELVESIKSTTMQHA